MPLPLGDFDLSPFAVITCNHDCNSFQRILSVSAIYQTWSWSWRPLNMQCRCVILSFWVWIGFTVSFLAKKISQKWWDVHSEIIYIGWGFRSGCFFLHCLPREKTAVMSWDMEKLTVQGEAHLWESSNHIYVLGNGSHFSWQLDCNPTRDLEPEALC